MVEEEEGSIEDTIMNATTEEENIITDSKTITEIEMDKTKKKKTDKDLRKMKETTTEIAKQTRFRKPDPEPKNSRNRLLI